jgi:hypothetical protein
MPLLNPFEQLIFTLKMKDSWHQWLMPVILAPQEAESRRIVVRSQPGQIVLPDPILKKGLVEWLKV